MAVVIGLEVKKIQAEKKPVETPTEEKKPVKPVVKTVKK